MTAHIVILKSAEADLKELRSYVSRNFGQETWQATLRKLNESIELIRSYPEGGSIPSELERLQLVQYRQVISGMNRIVYEMRGDTTYIHVVCDARRDLRALLMRRLLGDR